MTSNSVSSKSMSGDSMSSIGSNWSGMSNWDMRDSVDWGGMSSHNSLGGVGLVCGVVDMRGLNDLLDRVNLVRSWDWDGTGNGNLIRLGNMLVDNDLTGNGTWDGDRDINVVFLDIDLGDNVGELRSDSGVSSDWGKDSLLDNGISRSWAVVNRCRGDGSIRCWDNGEDWRGKSTGLNKVLGSSSNIRGSRLGDGFVSSNSISVPSNNLLDSGLDSSLSNNSIFNMVFNYCGSGSIRSMSLSNNSWSTCYWCSNKSSSISSNKTMSSISKMSSTNKAMGIVGRSSISTGHKGNSNLTMNTNE